MKLEVMMVVIGVWWLKGYKGGKKSLWNTSNVLFLDLSATYMDH